MVLSTVHNPTPMVGSSEKEFELKKEKKNENILRAIFFGILPLLILAWRETVVLLHWVARVTGALQVVRVVLLFIILLFGEPSIGFINLGWRGLFRN